MTKASAKRFLINRRYNDDYPDRMELLKAGKFKEENHSFEELIDK